LNLVHLKFLTYFDELKQCKNTCCHNLLIIWFFRVLVL